MDTFEAENSSTGSERFAPSDSEAEIKMLTESQDSINTVANTHWAVNTRNTWKRIRC